MLKSSQSLSSGRVLVLHSCVCGTTMCYPSFRSEDLRDFSCSKTAIYLILMLHLMLPESISLTSRSHAEADSIFSTTSYI